MKRNLLLILGLLLSLFFLSRNVVAAQFLCVYHHTRTECCIDPEGLHNLRLVDVHMFLEVGEVCLEAFGPCSGNDVSCGAVLPPPEPTPTPVEPTPTPTPIPPLPPGPTPTPTPILPPPVAATPTPGVPPPVRPTLPPPTPGTFRIGAPQGFPIRQPSAADKDTTIGNLINFAITIFIIIGIAASVIWLLYGAVKYITSGGDKAAIESAKIHIVSAIVGLIILVFTFVIINLVLSIFGAGTLSGTTFTIPDI